MTDSKTLQRRILLSCRGIHKSFGGRRALNGIDLEMATGELIAVLGPSGCGKSTFLRILAGLERADAGTIRYQDQLWSGAAVCVAPEKRDCGLVFQDLALFPHLNVSGNIGFGVAAGNKRAVVAEMLALVNLPDAGEKMIHMLSGGEQQRVALARSLAPHPKLLLLDEPFSSLDLQLRQQMRTEVRTILKKQGVGAILVTHDQNEAFAFADRVAVMGHGKFLQTGASDDIYLRPATTKIAAFVGEANFLPVRKGQEVVDVLLKKMPPSARFGAATLMCRPEDVQVESASENAAGRIVALRFQGDRQLLDVALNDGSTLTAYAPSRHNWHAGQEIAVTLSHVCLYDQEGRLWDCCEFKRP